jgi:hypothetical protein
LGENAAAKGASLPPLLSHKTFLKVKNIPDEVERAKRSSSSIHPHSVFTKAARFFPPLVEMMSHTNFGGFDFDVAFLLLWLSPYIDRKNE